MQIKDPTMQQLRWSMRAKEQHFVVSALALVTVMVCFYSASVVVHPSAGQIQVTHTGAASWTAAGPFTASSSKYVIAVATINRPGNVSYLENTLQSLYCAFGFISDGRDLVNTPPVVVFNNEVPASLHKVASALMGGDMFQTFHRYGLNFVTLTSMHNELHSPDYVLELARRSAAGFKVCPQKPRLSFSGRFRLHHGVCPQMLGLHHMAVGLS